jgi:hypothetical protein
MMKKGNLSFFARATKQYNTISNRETKHFLINDQFLALILACLARFKRPRHARP